MTSRSNGKGTSMGQRRSASALAPIVRGHSGTKIRAQAPGPNVSVVDSVHREVEAGSAVSSSAADGLSPFAPTLEPVEARDSAHEITSSVAETDDVVHAIDYQPSSSTTRLSPSKSRFKASSPCLVDLTAMLAGPADSTSDVARGPCSTSLQTDRDTDALILDTSRHDSVAMSTSRSLSPVAALLLKAGSGSLKGSKGRGHLLQAAAHQEGNGPTTSPASALLINASAAGGGSGSLRSGSAKNVLQRAVSRTGLLMQHSGSSKRLVHAVGKVLHQMKPTQEGTRQSFTDGAAAVARTAAVFSRRMSLLRSDTNVNAEELEHELNDMAASQMSLLARRHRAPFYLSVHSRVKMWWDAVLAVLTLYAVVVVPMDLCFNLCDEYTWMHGMQGVVEAVFVVDIMVAFRTSFLVSATHEEVTDVHVIRRHYLTLWFWVDCVASIPSSVLGHAFRHSDFAYLRLLVFLRVLRLSTSPTFPKTMSWASRTFTSSGVRLTILLSMYLLLHHYVACSYYLLVEFERKADRVGVAPTWRVPFEANDTLGTKYLGSYFRGLVVTSGSDLDPCTNLERVWGALMFTVGIIANACVAGICKSMLTQMNKVQDEQVHRQDSIDLCLRNCHATDDLTSKINAFYSTAHSHESAHHASDLFQTMPEKLHFELSVALNQSFLNKVPLFRALEPEGIVAVMECVEETVAMPGDLIIRAGERGRAFYMIKMGTVEVFDNLGPKGSRVSIKHMQAGEFFGEMSLIQRGVASANVAATSFCVLLVLYKEIFDWITMENDELKSFMERSKQRRSSEASEARRRSHMTSAVDVAKVTQGLIKRRSTFVPKRLQAMIARVRLRRAARWVMIIKRMGAPMESMDSSSRQSMPSMSRHFGKQDQPHLSMGLAAKMRTLMHANRCRSTATRALRAVTAMSQYTAKEMVESKRIKIQHM